MELYLSGFTCRKRLDVYISAAHHLNTYPHVPAPGRLDPLASGNVLEPMDEEHWTSLLLSLAFPEGREREESFNIRPSFGFTLSTTKYLWLQIRCKRGIERKEIALRIIGSDL